MPDRLEVSAETLTPFRDLTWRFLYVMEFDWTPDTKHGDPLKALQLLIDSPDYRYISPMHSQFVAADGSLIDIHGPYMRKYIGVDQFELLQPEAAEEALLTWESDADWGPARKATHEAPVEMGRIGEIIRRSGVCFRLQELGSEASYGWCFLKAFLELVAVSDRSVALINAASD